jgi:hypothetical protein
LPELPTLAAEVCMPKAVAKEMLNLASRICRASSVAISLIAATSSSSGPPIISVISAS